MGAALSGAPRLYLRAAAGSRSGIYNSAVPLNPDLFIFLGGSFVEPFFFFLSVALLRRGVAQIPCSCSSRSGIYKKGFIQLALLPPVS